MDIVPAEADEIVAAPASEGTARVELCGRCRKPSGNEQEGPPPAGVTFWLCPACHDKLLGGTGRVRRP